MNNGCISVLVIDGESAFSLPVLRCLGQAPVLKVHVLSNARWAQTRFSRHCASFHHHDARADDDRYVEAIGRVAKRVDADVLLSVDEPAIRFAANHREVLGRFACMTAVPPPDTFDTGVDKWRLADFMQKQGISTPRTILSTADGDFEQRLDTLAFPVLIKPRCGDGGRGIRRFDARTSLEQFLEARRTEADTYIVQNQVRGYDIDCSVLCRDGEILAYTIQKGIFTNPVRFRPPLAIEFLRHEEVLKVMQKLLAALHWSGVAHVDLMVDEDEQRVKVVELNARYWGSLLGSLAAGVNFPYLACLSALDRPLPPTNYRCVRYIAPSAVRQVRRQRSLTSGVPGFRFSETGWRYLLADPMPAAVDKISTTWKKLSTLRSRR